MTNLIETIKIDPEKINALTDIESGYKLFNVNLANCYNGLHPASLSKLCQIIFTGILTNKVYKKPDAKGYNENEAKRIFSSISLQPSDLVRRINPVKFSDGKNEVETDISNILKKLEELDEYNIFYTWRFKQPHTYIFVMERDIASWKYYNSRGKLYPKSLKKILRLAKSMIDTMEILDKERGRTSLRSEIEDSFGDFINKLLCKMDIEVSSLLPKFSVGSNVFTYTSSLLGELKKVEDFAKYSYDELFLERLPDPIRKKLIKTKKTENTDKEKTMDTAMLEQELIPKNENLIKAKKAKLQNRQKTHTGISVGVIKAETIVVKETDPFKNPTELIRFYRAFIRQYNKDARFFDFSAEVLYGSSVLDILTLNGRGSDMRFLRAWIRYYANNVLKGNSALKEEKTSIREFAKTFEMYNKSYIG